MARNETRTQTEAAPDAATDRQKESTVTASSSRDRKSPMLGWLERYALLGVLLAVFVFFSLYGPTSETFPTAANLKVVLGGQAVLAIVALGALIPLISKNGTFPSAPAPAFLRSSPRSSCRTERRLRSH